MAGQLGHENALPARWVSNSRGRAALPCTGLSPNWSIHQSAVQLPIIDRFSKAQCWLPPSSSVNILSSFLGEPQAS